VPLPTLVAHIAKDALYKDVYQFLATLPMIECTPELLNALFLRAQDKLSWLLLCKTASSKTGVPIFMASPGWLEFCSAHPREELCLFMILASIPSLRPALAAFPRYPTLLKVNARLADDAIRAAIAVVAGRCDVSESVHRRFSADGFWKALFTAVQATQNAEVQLNCMALVGRFCAVGWTEEFADYMPHLAMQLSSGDLAATAIQILTSLSFLRESARVFIEIGMIEYFEQLMTNPYWAECAEQILANVRRSP
jgi:hypothetical protein